MIFIDTPNRPPMYVIHAFRTSTQHTNQLDWGLVGGGAREIAGSDSWPYMGLSPPFSSSVPLSLVAGPLLLAHPPSPVLLLLVFLAFSYLLLRDPVAADRGSFLARATHSLMTVFITDTISVFNMSLSYPFS